MSGSVDLASSIVIMAELDKPIRHDFSTFWPDLVDFARGWKPSSLH
jgi:hypothetical protein